MLWSLSDACVHILQFTWENIAVLLDFVEKINKRLHCKSVELWFIFFFFGFLFTSMSSKFARGNAAILWAFAEPPESLQTGNKLLMKKHVGPTFLQWGICFLIFFYDLRCHI